MVWALHDAGRAVLVGAAEELENRDINVRFNGVYLAFVVKVDKEAVEEEAAKMGAVKASDFARVYRAC